MERPYEYEEYLTLASDYLLLKRRLEVMVDKDRIQQNTLQRDLDRHLKMEPTPTVLGNIDRLTMEIDTLIKDRETLIDKTRKDLFELTKKLADSKYKQRFYGKNPGVERDLFIRELNSQRTV